MDPSKKPKSPCIIPRHREPKRKLGAPGSIYGLCEEAGLSELGFRVSGLGVRVEGLGFRV